MADCKKPRKDAATTSSSKGKGKGTKANPQPKASSSGTPAAKPAPKAKAGAQKRGQSQPKAKAKAKGSAHSAEADNSEIDWARTALEDSNVATEVFSASLASFAPTDVAATSHLHLHQFCPLILIWLVLFTPLSILHFMLQRFQVRTVFFLLSWIQALLTAYCPSTG